MMNTFDIVLLNILSYLLGIGTGLTICCKYKEKFMSRSKSIDNIRQMNHQTYAAPVIEAMPHATAPTEITLKM
jgi:hypothetical protein